MAVKAYGLVTLVRTDDGVGVSAYVTEFYKSTSATSLAGGSWSTARPTWENGKYIWSRNKTTLTSGTVTYSEPICVTGGTGSTGKGVTSITPEYYLSTSKTAQSGGSWVTAPPAWISGKYLWTRHKIIYTNPSSTVYTTPVCDSSWEAVNEITIGGRNLLKNSVNGYAVTGSDMPTVSTRSGRTIKTLTTAQGNAYVFVQGYLALSVVEISKLVGESFTFSVDVKVTGSFANAQISIDIRNNGTKFLMPVAKISDSCKKGEWIRVYGIDIVKSIASVTPVNSLFCISWSGSTVGSTIEYRNPKLEKGNKPTDWAPAPEDLDQFHTGTTAPIDKTKLWCDTSLEPPMIKYWNGTEWIVTNDFSDDINNMKQQVTVEYNSAINQLKDSLSTLVEKLQTTTTDNATLIEQLSSQIIQNASSISLVTNSINSINNNISGLATKEEISQWARFQGGVLELGASNSPFAVKLSNTELGFYQNGSRIAYLSNQQLNIEYAIVMTKLNIGIFNWGYDETDGLTLT